MWQETWGSSRVSIGEKGLFLSCEGKVRIPLETKQENQPSSHNEVGNKGLFSSCGRKLVVPLEW